MADFTKRAQVIKIPDALGLMIYLQTIIKQVRPDNTNNSAFHYTDLNGFMSIIDNHELWLSNVNFINDRNELQDGISICQKVINNYLEGNLTKKQKHGLDIILSKLNDGSSDGSWATNKFDVFASSFCKEGDLLTQWRGYGSNGGIAIGFDQQQLQDCRLMDSNLYNKEISNGTNPEEMMPHNELIPFLQKVIYDDYEKEVIVKIILDLYLDSLDQQKNDVLFDLACSEFSDIIFRYIPLFKNKSFFSEQELRYIYSIKETKRKLIDFRTRNGLILPFVKLKLLDYNCRPLKYLPISKIVIGPCLHSEDLLKSVKYFLKNSGNLELVDNVTPSVIPYRG